MSNSIITLDVGGQIFKTQITTLTKYPGSMLATMFNHIDSGLGMISNVIFFLINKVHCIPYFKEMKEL